MFSTRNLSVYCIKHEPAKHVIIYEDYLNFPALYIYVTLLHIYLIKFATIRCVFNYLN